MTIDRNHIVQLLRQRGDEDQAREAERQLPVQVDPAAHADALEQLGLNPQNLLDDDAAYLEHKLDPDDIVPYA